MKNINKEQFIVFACLILIAVAAATIITVIGSLNFTDESNPTALAKKVDEFAVDESLDRMLINVVSPDELSNQALGYSTASSTPSELSDIENDLNAIDNTLNDTSSQPISSSDLTN